MKETQLSGFAPAAGSAIPRLGCAPWYPKQDSRPPLGLWAPGEYLNCCFSCGEHFIWDKRAVKCADCAYKSPNQPSSPTGADGAEAANAH